MKRADVWNFYFEPKIFHRVQTQNKSGMMEGNGGEGNWTNSLQTIFENLDLFSLVLIQSKVRIKFGISIAFQLNLRPFFPLHLTT